MPYLPEAVRKAIDRGRMPVNPGQLNYKITTDILKYLDEIEVSMMKERNNYSDYNEVMGVLECVKQELYRKVISKHEDKKCEENGEVYE